MSTFCHYSRTAKLFLRGNHIFTHFKQQCRKTDSSRNEHYLILEHLNDANLLTSIIGDAMLFLIAAYKQINSSFILLPQCPFLLPLMQNSSPLNKTSTIALHNQGCESRWAAFIHCISQCSVGEQCISHDRQPYHLRTVHLGHGHLRLGCRGQENTEGEE